MPKRIENSLPPVFAAMAALDEAIAAHNVLLERLAGAMEEGTRLDEQLRRIDWADQEKLIGAAQALAFAVALVQSIAAREARARIAMHRAQADLVETRRVENRARLEELRTERETDAASIWDFVGRFEAEVRARLEEHAKLAAEMQFVASAAGEPQNTTPAAARLAPALGKSGPNLWNALAGGVRHLFDRRGSLVPGPAAARPALAAAERFDLARPVVVAEKIVPPASALPVRAAPQVDFARPALVAEKIASPPAPAIPVRAAPQVVFARPAVVAEKIATPASAIPVRGAPQVDFARPAVVAEKIATPAPAIPVRGAPRGPAAPKPDGRVAGRPGPVEPENKRGRLDRILRDLARMVSLKPGQKRSR
jgi:hypothetical protein